MTIRMQTYMSNYSRILEITVNKSVSWKYEIYNVQDYRLLLKIFPLGLNNFFSCKSGFPRNDFYYKIYPVWLHKDWVCWNVILCFVYNNFDFFVKLTKVRTPMSQETFKRWVSHYLDSASAACKNSLVLYSIKVDSNSMYYDGATQENYDFVSTDCVYECSVHILGVIWGPDFITLKDVLTYHFRSLSTYLNCDYKFYLWRVSKERRSLKNNLMEYDLKTLYQSRSESYYSSMLSFFRDWVEDYINFDFWTSSSIYMYSPVYKVSNIFIFKRVARWPFLEHDQLEVVIDKLSRGGRLFRVYKMGFVTTSSSIFNHWYFIKKLLKVIAYLDDYSEAFETFILYNVNYVEDYKLNNDFISFASKFSRDFGNLYEIRIKVFVFFNEFKVSEEVAYFWNILFVKIFKNLFFCDSGLFVSIRQHSELFSDSFVDADLKRFYQQSCWVSKNDNE